MMDPNCFKTTTKLIARTKNTIANQDSTSQTPWQDLNNNHQKIVTSKEMRTNFKSKPQHVEKILLPSILTRSQQSGIYLKTRMFVKKQEIGFWFTRGDWWTVKRTLNISWTSNTQTSERLASCKRQRNEARIQIQIPTYKQDPISKTLDEISTSPPRSPENIY